MKAKRLLALLTRDPLSYRVVRQSGSHRRLVSDNYPPLTFAFHDSDTESTVVVRKILERDVGLTAEQATDILGL